ncbi:MAG: adenylosuccinate lyase, partial [Brachybacterium sp.]
MAHSFADITPQIALTPLDGRYRAQVAPLVDHLSEAALNRSRLVVETEWMIHLLDQQVIPGLRTLTEDERALLRAIPED